jgi:glutamine amidotransferase
VCRHLAYLGPPRRVGQLLSDPPHALIRQAWAPRLQRHATVNADGFGLGWYGEGVPEPARHRGDGPIWADETTADLARVVRTRCLLAAVRSATPGMRAGGQAAAPFRRRHLLFSHNGLLERWPESAEPLAARLAPAQLLAMDPGSDSGLLWALVLDRLDRGVPPGAALAEVVGLARTVTTGRFNLLLTDGRTVAATAAGDSLWWLAAVPTGGSPDTPGEPDTPQTPRGGGVVVASEPYDDDPAWCEVPDDHVLVTDGATVRVESL